MTPTDEQIQRIKNMEEMFDRVNTVVTSLSEILYEYSEVLPMINQLSEYYDSGLWRQDYEADESSLIPSDIKRGILTEDALWNMLSENEEIRKMISKLYKSMSNK